MLIRPHRTLSSSPLLARASALGKILSLGYLRVASQDRGQAIRERRLSERCWSGHVRLALKCRFVLTTLLLLLGLLRPADADGMIIRGQPTVVSGDTLDFDEIQIRLFDVDAPEIDQTCLIRGGVETWPCGREAARALSQALDEFTVSCETMGTDYGGRWFARCSVDTLSLAALMASNGWAVPNQECRCIEVRVWSAFAKSRNLGIWSGTFVWPWEWRKEHQ
jgi:endonuclease YncB( thermonuclease family)